MCTEGATTATEEPRRALSENAVPDGVKPEVADRGFTTEVSELESDSTAEDVALAIVVPVFCAPAAGEEAAKPPGLVETAEVSATPLGSDSEAGVLDTREVNPPELVVVEDGTDTGATSEGEVVPDDPGVANVEDGITADVVVGGAVLRKSEVILHRRTVTISTVGAGPHGS